MAVGDVFKLQVVWARNDVAPVAVNDFFYQRLGAIVQADEPSDLIVAFQAVVLSSYTNLVTNLLEILTYKVSEFPGFETVAEFPQTGVVGGVSGEALPPRTATLIRKRSTTLGRRGRGYFYLPPSGENQSGGSNPTSSFLSNATAFCGNALNGMKIASATHGAWSMVHYMPSTGTYSDVTLLTPGQRWSSQVDRKLLY